MFYVVKDNNEGSDYSFITAKDDTEASLLLQNRYAFSPETVVEFAQYIPATQLELDTLSNTRWEVQESVRVHCEWYVEGFCKGITYPPESPVFQAMVRNV